MGPKCLIKSHEPQAEMLIPQGEAMLKRTIFIAALTLVCTTFAAAQEDKSKRPSPPAQAQCKFSDGKTITVDYSSPRANGRKIFGGLVPYAEVCLHRPIDATTYV